MGFDPFDEDIGRRIARSAFFWNAADQLQPAPLRFTLEPGDQVYLLARLQASASSVNRQPSLSDAYNTLTMTFRDPAGLLPASAVPEPGAAACLALGLAALCLVRIVRPADEAHGAPAQESRRRVSPAASGRKPR